MMAEDRLKGMLKNSCARPLTLVLVLGFLGVFEYEDDDEDEYDSETHRGRINQHALNAGLQTS